MKLVPAKCPFCGGTLEVDPAKEAAICEFCKSPFIVEKAINNYSQNIKYQSVNNSGTINIDSLNVGSFIEFDKLNELAQAYIKSQDFEKAESYIDKALELKPNDSDMLFLKARCLSYRQTDKIPPFSFLILSFKNAQNEREKELRMKSISKYLLQNCSVLDEFLYEDFKNVCTGVFDLENLYSKLIVSFKSKGVLIIDDYLKFSGHDGYDAKIFIITACNHDIFSNLTKKKLIDISANSGNLTLVYRLNIFGEKLEKA